MTRWQKIRVPVLFAIIVLIWSTTWYGIKLQTNGTPPVLSVGLRFSIAAALLLAYLFITNQQRISLPALRLVALQGLLFFGLTYGLEYAGMQYMTSGLVALVFSTTLLFNLLNEWLWFSRRPARATLLAGVIGIIGLLLIFLPEWDKPQDPGLGLGIGLVLAAAFCASLGNVLGSKLLKDGTPVVTMNAYAMATGAIVSLCWASLNNEWELLQATPSYIGALLYLALVGSVVAFGLYFSLMRDIGPSRGAYATVAVPAFALLISTFVEDYRWSLASVSGMLLVMIGNAIILRTREAVSTEARQRLEGHAAESDASSSRAER